MGTEMITRQLAEFIASLRYGQLPRDVTRMAVMCVLDWAGSALRGSMEEPARIMEKILAAEGGREEATFVGFGKKGPSLAAALLNGVAAHTVEMDDLHRASILHPAAPIITAAMAAAERANASGKTLLEGVVAGYETGIRIGEAVTPAHYYYWHNTGTCGTFGAAAAAGKILGLPVDGLVQALGSGGTQAAGLWEFHHDGAMSKHLHAGKAASNGLLAAYLAAGGFSAASRILEGEKGFFRAFASSYDAGRVTDLLGEEFRLLDNSFKLYPSCRHTHGGVDLMLELHREQLEPRRIREITYETYSSAADLVGSNAPATPFQAKFSLPCCGAMALLWGKLELDDFNEENLRNPLVLKLMDISRVEKSEWAEEAYPGKWRTAIKCRLDDGTVISGETDTPRGDPENPPAEGELETKFLKLAAPVLGVGEAEQLLQKIVNLDQLDGVRDLF